MGTRSLTHVYHDDKVILTLYRQFDGYPEGLGLDLAKFLDGFVVVNGFGIKNPEKCANGMGCLAAQLVCHLKDGVGNVYIYPVESKDCDEEYVYHIRHEEGIGLTIEIRDADNKKLTLKGTPKALLSAIPKLQHDS